MLLDRLHSWPKNSERVFGKKSYSPLRKRFREYFTKVGIDSSGTFHRFRHTTASALVDQGFNEFDVKVFLGHADSTVTQGYLSLGAKRFHDLADALEKWLADAISSGFRPNIH